MTQSVIDNILAKVGSGTQYRPKSAVNNETKSQTSIMAKKDSKDSSVSKLQSKSQLTDITRNEKSKQQNSEKVIDDKNKISQKNSKQKNQKQLSQQQKSIDHQNNVQLEISDDKPTAKKNTSVSNSAQNGQNNKQNQKQEQVQGQTSKDEKIEDEKQNQLQISKNQQKSKNNENERNKKQNKKQQDKGNLSPNKKQGGQNNNIKQQSPNQNQNIFQTPNVKQKHTPLKSSSFKMEINKTPQSKTETVIGCFGKVKKNKVLGQNKNIPIDQQVNKKISEIKQIDVDKFSYEKQSYHDFMVDGKFSISSILRSNELFKKTNIGLYLYFQFLFYLFILLGLLMFPSLVRIILNYYQFNGFINSNYNSSMQTKILKYSVGNMQNPSFYHFNISIACQSISILLIFGFYVFWRYKTENYIDKYSIQVPEISQYSIGITLNPNVNKYQIQIEQLKNQQLFEYLDQIAPIYDFKGQYQNIKEYIKLQKQLDIKTDQTNKQKTDQTNKQKTDQTNKQKEEKIKKLGQTIRSSDLKNFQKNMRKSDQDQYPLDPVMYIMQFKTKKARMVMIDQLMKRHQIDTWYPSFFCCKQDQKDNKQLSQIKIKINEKNTQKQVKIMLTEINVSNPQDMTWENVKVSSLQQFLARIFIFLTIPFITVGSSLLVSFTGKEVQVNKLSRQVNCKNFNDLSEQYVQQNIVDLDLTYCYCLENFPSFGDICSEKTKYTSQIINGMMASSATAFLSTSMNLIMVQAIPYLTNLGKYKTISEKENIAYWLTTFATVVNSLFLPLITSLQFNGISLASLIGYYTKATGVPTDSTNSSQLQNPNVSFPDMTRDWYMYALPFYFSLLVNAILIPLLQCLLFFSPKLYEKIKGLFQGTPTNNQKINQQNNLQKKAQRNQNGKQSQNKVKTTIFNDIKKYLKETIQKQDSSMKGFTFQTMIKKIRERDDGSQSKTNKLSQDIQKILQTYLKTNINKDGKDKQINQSIKQIKQNFLKIISQKGDDLINKFQDLIKKNIPSHILSLCKQKLIQSMEKAQINEEILFNFSIQKNANMLTFNLFIILCYSVQQPLFIIMGCLMVLVEYCSHKFIVIKYSKKMKIKKGEINQKFLTLLPVIIVIRCIFSIMTYTCPQMFQKQLFEHLNIWSYTIENYPVMERFLQIGIFSVLIVLSLLLVLVHYFFNDINAALLMMFQSYRTKKINQTKDKVYQSQQIKKKYDKKQYQELKYFDNKIAYYEQKNNISTPFLRSYDVYKQYPYFAQTLINILSNQKKKNNDISQQPSHATLLPKTQSQSI